MNHAEKPSAPLQHQGGLPQPPDGSPRQLGGRRRPGAWLWGSIPAVLVLAMWAYHACTGGFSVGGAAGAGLARFLLEMVQILPAMFILVGLFDVWVPKRIIERHLGSGSGPFAILWMVLLATLQAGPLYAAFPVAAALWRKGTAPRNVFIYLGAFSAAKIPMLSFEVAFLGWQFSLLRTTVTLPVFIGLGYLLERLIPAVYTPCPSADGPDEAGTPAL